MKFKQYKKAMILACVSSIAFFLFFGIVTAIIPNVLFTRMSPITWLEYASLILTSLLLGAYIGLSRYESAIRARKCNMTAAAGGITGFLTFGCSVCNKLLVLLLGVTGILQYFEPIRPAFGLMSLALLVGALFYRLRRIKRLHLGR